MNEENLMLYVASYDDAGGAADDFAALKDAELDEIAIVGAVLMDREDDGDVNVEEHHTGLVGGGAVTGGAAGLIVGLFAPPLLLSTAIGAGIGAGVGELVKRHEEKELGVELDEYLPPGSSAIVAVVDDRYLDRIDKALDKSAKKVSKAIDSGDYDKVKKAVLKSEGNIADAIES